MFRKLSTLPFIAAVVLVVAAVPAPVAAQLEASAVAGYGFRSQSQQSRRPSISGPLVRAGALLRVVKPIALGVEIGRYWPGEARYLNDLIKHDRLISYTLCAEIGKPRPGISPRLTLGYSRNSVSTTTFTTFEGRIYTSTSSEKVLSPHLGFAMVRKPAGAKMGLRAEVRAAAVGYWEEELYLAISTSAGVAF
jgi:hypothetical protein